MQIMDAEGVSWHGALYLRARNEISASDGDGFLADPLEAKGRAYWMYASLCATTRAGKKTSQMMWLFRPEPLKAEGAVQGP